MQSVEYTRQDLMEEHKTMTPRLKKLAKIVLKEITYDVTKETQPEEESTRVETARIKALPIFLWPAEHTASDISKTSISSQDTIAADTERQSNTVQHKEERRLHDTLTGIHRQLLKPFRPSSIEHLHSVQYAIIEDKTVGQVNMLLHSIYDKAQRDTNPTDCETDSTALIIQSIYKSCQKIINPLVPKHCEDTVIAKYWGSCIPITR